MLDDITPMVLTYNEAANIRRTLEKLAWSERIVLVDSGSSDDTLSIAAGFKNVEVVTRAFTTFAEQCNFGLTHITSEWVLSLDADYVLSDALVEELGSLESSDNVNGYRVPFVYCVNGRPLRGTLYPPRAVLYRVRKGCYHDFGHGHRVTIEGDLRGLANPIYHDDRKSLQRWFDSQRRYAIAEVDYLLSEQHDRLNVSDRLRRSGWIMPLLVLPYTLLMKRVIFDGWPGWSYALQRLLAEVLIALELLERRLKTGQNSKRGRA